MYDGKSTVRHATVPLVEASKGYSMTASISSNVNYAVTHGARYNVLKSGFCRMTIEFVYKMLYTGLDEK